MWEEKKSLVRITITGLRGKVPIIYFLLELLLIILVQRHKWKFIYLSGAVMEHFLEGSALLRLWYINSEKKIYVSVYNCLNRAIPSRKYSIYSTS